MPGRSYGIYNLIAIFPGYLGTQFIYLAQAVTASLLTSDKDSVLIIGLYVDQPA